jgi:ubiquinone/menaquinone biosynthesis C-methylase UbiE
VNPPDQIAAIRDLFDLVSGDYDNVGVPFFGPIAEGLVEAVDARPGDRAADFGCGSGVSSVALASAIGPNGSLVAVDVSPAMVERARASIGDRLSHVEVRVGDVSAPELPTASLDTVISSLVVFFLPDPVAAVANWVRLLAPEGRLGLSTFGQASPEWQALEAHLRESMPPMDPRMVGPKSPFASDGGMEAMLSSAGAAEVTTSSRRVEFSFEDFEHWVRFTRSVGQRVAWERMSRDDTASVMERARRTYDEAAGPDGRLPVWQDVRYTVGVAPA